MPATLSTSSPVRRRDVPTSPQVAELLGREIPFIFHRNLLDAEFVATHREVSRRVLATAVRSKGSTGTGDPPAMLAAVGGAWNLPDLLTPDEEQSLFIALNALRRLANAERSQLNPHRPSQRRVRQLMELLNEAEAVRTHLVEANVRLVVSVAGKLADANVGFDELFSEGLLILLKSIDGFDFSRGFRFSTYATNSLQRHFFRLRRRTVRKRQFGKPVPGELLLDVMGEPDAMLPAEDPVALYQRVMSVGRTLLDDRERRIVELRFGLGGAEHTLREIATVLRVSKERVRQVLARAVAKLQSAASALHLEWAPREPAPTPRLSL